MSAMKPIRVLAACAALGLVATGAIAQEQSQANANNNVSSQYADRQNAIATDNAAAEGQYSADMAAYRDAVRAQHQDSMRDQAHYMHQQRAYADAMRAWRHQTWACKHGSNAACNAPTPDPAAFW
jgi:hypothetical protein